MTKALARAAALLLASGQLAWPPIGEVAHADRLQGLSDPLFYLILGHAFRSSSPKATFWATVICGQRA